MNFDTLNPQPLANLTDNDAAATQFLRERCWPQRAPDCPRCGGAKLYRLADRRHRCAQCRYTFSDFAGRWLSVGGLRPSEWLALLRAFANGATVQAVQERLGVVYSTAHKGVTTVRRAIAAHAADAALLLPVILAEGKSRDQAGRGLLFGVRVGAPHLRIAVVTHLNVADVLAADLGRVQRGPIVYTEGMDAYLGFCFWHHQAISRTCQTVAMWEDLRAMWTFTNTWRQRRRRISAWQYALHVKEMEFRVNHADRDRFGTLLDYVCDRIPSPNPPVPLGPAPKPLAL